MKITIDIPDRPAVTAADYLDTAVRAWGWDPAQGITAQEYLLDRVEEQLDARWRSGQRTLSRDEAEAAVPRPTSRGLAVAAEREVARVAAEAERGGAGGARTPPEGGS